MTGYRFATIRFAIVAVIFVQAVLSGALGVQAAPLPQVTLIYDQDSVTLVNSGEVDIDLTLLTFVRNDDTSTMPVRYDGRSWQIDSLAAGQCVQLRSFGVGKLIRGKCNRLVKWLSTTREDAYFWQKAESVTEFRVAFGSEEVATCEIMAGECIFALYGLPRFEALTLTYTPQSFYLSNEGITPIPLGRLRICGATDTGDTAPPCDHLVATDTLLKPGDCLRIGSYVPLDESNCLSIRVLQIGANFWTASFVVISPVTADSTLCPAALVDQSQRCIVPG